MYKHDLHKSINGLGLTANGKRKINSGNAFNSFFPKPINTDPYINMDGTVHDTIGYCGPIVLKTLNDTAKISKLLKRKTLKDTCEAVFDFFYKHYQYEVDKEGVEQLRRPSRAWADRHKGIDCDCFTISVSSILTNLGIPHSFRMCELNNKGYFQHIYVVVPKYTNANLKVRSNYYVIDPVVDRFDLEAPGITNIKDKEMSLKGMPIQFLNGVNETRFGEEFNGLGDALGSDDLDGLHREFLHRAKKHLVNTRNLIAKNPKRYNHMYNVNGLVGAYDQLIGSWDNDATRSQTLDKLSGMDESFLQPAFQGLGDIIHGPENELFGLINADLDGLDGLSGKKQKARKAATGSSKQKRKTGVFTKIKNVNKNIKGKAKGVLKKIAKNVLLKYNPALLPIRAGFLVAMKTNFARIASRVYWAYFTEAEAVKAGVSRSFYQSAVKGLDFVKKTFVQKLGGDEATLKKSIITGRAAKVSQNLANKGKLNGIDQLLGVDGLGVVAAATTTAALTFLTAIAGFLTKVMGKKGAEGKEETETGGETEPTSDVASEGFKQTSVNDTVANDNSEQAYKDNVDSEEPGKWAAEM